MVHQVAVVSPERYYKERMKSRFTDPIRSEIYSLQREIKHLRKMIDLGLSR